ncbi:MAG: ATP-binding protein [Pseudonocardiaceae bacterium]
MPPAPSDHRKPSADGEVASQDEPQTRSLVGFQLVLAAEPAALSVIRDRFRQWLKAHQWPAAELADLVLAVSEAASNVVEHAYPHGRSGDIEIDGCVTVLPGGARVVELTVRDRGCWRQIPDRPENQRRGISLMRAVVAELVIDGTERGTCVRMRGRHPGR